MLRAKWKHQWGCSDASSAIDTEGMGSKRSKINMKPEKRHCVIRWHSGFRLKYYSVKKLLGLCTFMAWLGAYCHFGTANEIA